MLAIFTISFSACSDDDANGDTALLEAYGPSPAMRGGKLTFIGKNLDQVTKVILPSNVEVTDIEVINSGQIKITIPQNAAVGSVRLVLKSGAELTSKTVLTYTEPVSITSMAPSPVKPGETLTIEGDYLNLVQKIVFSDGVEVMSKNFTTWERAKIEVVVPKAAQTGTIILADTAAIPLELESEIELQVVLPSVDKIADLTGKKPGDLIALTGKDLDLVDYVVVPDGSAAGDTINFKVEGTQLTFTLPTGTADGVVVMIPTSGVRVSIANIGMAIPSELVATPATNLRGGSVITIKGVNMDLVTTLTFPGVSDPVSPSSQTGTEIKVTVPDATTSGNLILNTASGNTVTIAISTLKPVVSSYDPAAVAAGTNVKLKGTNLDLVASVTFAGNKKVDVTPSGATELTVAVPVDAETGTLTLTMKNGETVSCPSLTVTKPVFCYIPVLPGEDDEIKSGAIFAFAVQNEDKLTGVQVNGTNAQYILQGTKLSVLMPSNANGNTTLKLISSNGEVSYTIYVINSSVIETTIFEGPISVTWGDGGRVMLPISDFENQRAGTILKLYFAQHDSWGQLQMNYGNWGNMPFAELGGGAYLTTDLLNDKSITEFELRLTQEGLDNIKTHVGEGLGFIIQGQDFTINRISLITGR